MSKKAIAVIAVGLLALGFFFYWGKTSATVETKQEEVAHTVTDPLNEAKDVDELRNDKESAEAEQIGEALDGE